MDGHEEQNGAHYRCLCGQFDRTWFRCGRFKHKADHEVLQQLATFVVPLLVIVGWMYVVLRCSTGALIYLYLLLYSSGHELTLFFANFEVRTVTSLHSTHPLSPTSSVGGSID